MRHVLRIIRGAAYMCLLAGCIGWAALLVTDPYALATLMGTPLVLLIAYDIGLFLEPPPGNNG